MAWNDPGKNENPWQRRPDKGPPDLDELLRRVQKKLRGLFGGGAGGGGRRTEGPATAARPRDRHRLRSPPGSSRCGSCSAVST